MNNTRFSTDYVPNSFKDSAAFADYEAAVHRTRDLPWEKLQDEDIAVEMTGLSALFSIEFYRALSGILVNFLDDSKMMPLEASPVSLFLNLSEEELAGGLPNYLGNRSHAWIALEAAHEAGYDISRLLPTVGAIGKIESINDIQPRNDGVTYGELNPIHFKFLRINDRYKKDYKDSTALLSLAGEFILSDIFDKISTHLPEANKFKLMHVFCDGHNEIDSGADGHTVKMSKALKGFITTPEEIEQALKVGTEVLLNRAILYSEVLEGRSKNVDNQSNDQYFSQTRSQIRHTLEREITKQLLNTAPKALPIRAASELVTRTARIEK